MLKIYGDVKSGNCYKVKLVAEQIQAPYHWIDVDIIKGETQTPEFKEVNPTGKIPVLVTSAGKTLAESNAIIWFLAQDTHLLPKEQFEQAEILQWMFFEQYMHEPFIATARFIKIYLGNPASKQGELASKMEKGYLALDVMEQHLTSTDFFVGGVYSIADVALFAYTHVAEEGGFSLKDYPNIRHWIERVKSQKHFITLG